MSVQQVAILYRDGRSAEEIQAAYDGVGLDLVYAGIAYYLANAAEIDAYLAEEARTYDELRSQIGPGRAARKLRGA